MEVGSKSGCPGGFLLPSKMLASHGYLSSGSLVCGLGFDFEPVLFRVGAKVLDEGSLGWILSGSYFHF